MKSAVLIISLFVVVTFVSNAASKLGVFYTLCEISKGQFTKYVKVGKSSEDNIKRRLSNEKAGNPRLLRYNHVYFCNTEDIAISAESDAKGELGKLQANLGGGTEWYHTPNLDIYKIFENVIDTVSKKYSCSLAGQKTCV